VGGGLAPLATRALYDLGLKPGYSCLAHPRREARHKLVLRLPFAATPSLSTSRHPLELLKWRFAERANDPDGEILHEASELVA
jgi:hypothetical protein